MRDFLLELFIFVVLILNFYGLMCELIEYIAKEPIEETTVTVYIK